MSHEQRKLAHPCNRSSAKPGLPLIFRTVFAGVLLAASGLRAPIAKAQTADAGDSGVFQVLADNKRVGIEKFQIKRSTGAWESTAELQIDGPKGEKVSETSTLRLDLQLRPVRYERIQTTPVKGNLVAEFSSTETQLAAVVDGGEPQQEEFELQLDNLAVLDTNFFHHYAFLVRLYDRNKGGAQPFNVFVPQEALPGTISLKLLGNEKVTVGQTAKDLDHFQAVTEELQIDIWARPDGAIERISIPSAKLEVVRQ